MTFHWHKNYLSENEAVELSVAIARVSRIHIGAYANVNGIYSYKIEPNTTKEDILDAAQIIIAFANSLEDGERQ